MKELERESQEPGFWDNPEISNRKMKEMKNLQDTIDMYNHLESQVEDLGMLIQMAYEENDEELVADIRAELDEFVE
ncbi:MAG: PCRF domain-containing protein, partial [Lachnospiraceae bacterium]|nr:PCRF domain-containing protein [Lachnospiraceae bacterium]